MRAANIKGGKVFQYKTGIGEGEIADVGSALVKGCGGRRGPI